MRFLSRSSWPWRNLDAPRVAATAFVLFAHVALILLLYAAMSTPDTRASSALRDSVTSLEFLPPEPPALVPQPPTAVAAMPPRARARATASKPTANRSSTAAIFLDDVPIASEPRRPNALNPDAGDAFDPKPAHKPFPLAPVFSSNLPKSLVRLPDRPSMLQAYWAVPEGENLQGRLARTVPVLGLVLAATGATGQPDCPPKSEHPDCIQRLIDGGRR